MKKIGLIFELSDNPYFEIIPSSIGTELREYVRPSEINELYTAFTNLGYDTEIIDSAKGLLSLGENAKQFDLFFNKSIGQEGLERKIIVPAIGLMNKLPMVGSSAYAMTLARHKYHSCALLSGMGFRVPFAWYFQNYKQVYDVDHYPVIVKPLMESDALGIYDSSVCNTYNELKKATQRIFVEFNQPVIVEQFISGEEWKVAVIGNLEEAKAFGCANTLKKGKPMDNTLQTRNDIINDTLSYSVPNNEYLVDKALEMAVKIHNLLCLSDYSRIDFRVGSDNKLYCMEVTTHPYLSKHNSSFICAATQTLDNYDSVINEILLSAHKRYDKKSKS